MPNLSPGFTNFDENHLQENLMKSSEIKKHPMAIEQQNHTHEFSRSFFQYKKYAQKLKKKIPTFLHLIELGLSQR